MVRSSVAALCIRGRETQPNGKPDLIRNNAMTKVAIPTDWKLLGTSSNARFYEVEPLLLAIVPTDDTDDNEVTARESLAFQEQHWRSVGHRGAVVCFMDPVLHQDGGARSVYVNETHDSLSTCFALVSETLFAQATASVFVGLAKPGIPTRIFPSLDAAKTWMDEMTAARGGDIST
jgi:hypothetical protein